MLRLMTEANRERFRRAEERIALAYRHVPVDEPAVVIQDVNYTITGEEPSEIADDYFDEGAFARQFNAQASRIVAHLERYDDSYVPFLFPWYGTGVVPSALGCRIVFPPKEEPAVEGPIITKPEEVKRLTPPDPARDGLMPRVLRCIDYMRANTDVPVSFTDCQGPFNIALNLVGIETIFLWMHDYPTIVHELMDFCTSVLIDWVKVQKTHAGQEVESGAFPNRMILPRGFGGVVISDDDCTIISPHLYRTFVVPYNSRVFKAFDGGTLHYCGSATHQFENFLGTDGLVGINNFCMGDFAQVFRAQQLFEDRVTMMVCDYTPLDIEGYFAELLAGLKPKGTILGTSPLATLAMVGRRVETRHRDPARIGSEAWRVIRRNLASRAPD